MIRLAPLLLLAGCLGPAPADTPRALFDQLWTDFDARYALFEARGVDWDDAHDAWSPEVDDTTSDDDLFEALFGLVAETGDDHVYLARFDARGNPTRVVTAGRLGGETRDDFDVEQITARVDLPGLAGGGRLRWGRLSDRVGWLHVASFDGAAPGDRPDAWTRDVEVALDDLGVDALVVDVRQNGGGRGANALAIASVLVRAPADVFRVRTRNGPEHDDFDVPTTWRVTPTGDRAPAHVVLLTDRFTMSAAETFVAALRTRPDVVHVGETTTGALSAKSHERQLANGWAYTVSVQDFRLPDGTSPEGVGFAPDVWADNTPEAVAAGADPMLDRALAEAEARLDGGR
jgi:carboxyl-terminal processing protease